RRLAERWCLVTDQMAGLPTVLRLPDEARRGGEPERRRDVDVVAAASVQRRRDGEARLAGDPLVIDDHRMPEREPGTCRPSRRDRGPRGQRKDEPHDDNPERQPSGQAHRNEPRTTPRPDTWLHLNLLLAVGDTQGAQQSEVPSTQRLETPTELDPYRP